MIAHRVAAPDAAALAKQFGMTDTVETNTPVDYETGAAARGTFRRGQRPTIPPETFQELGVGEAALRVVRAPLPERHRIITVYREETEQ